MSSSNMNVGEALSTGNSVPGIGGDASSTGVIDRAFRTSKIDEIEHLTNTLISPNKLIPQERDRTLSSEFQFHGTSDLCVFKTFYGCRISAELRYEAGDDRLAFVMASKGQGQLTLQRKEYLISGQQGVVFTSGPPNALYYRDDCEMFVLGLSI